MDSRDKLIRALARLQALKANLPSGAYISEIYVEQYHEAIKHLEDLGHDVDEFKVSPAHLERIPIGGFNDVTLYSRDRQVERPLLLSKIDAVLGYFELLVRDPPRKRPPMGFRPPSVED